MFQVSVEETFSAGHALRGYKGKCENVHGHNYRVRMDVKGDRLDSIGLLVDFGHVKKILRDLIGGIDHRVPERSSAVRFDQPVGGKPGEISLRGSFQTDAGRAERAADHQHYGMGDRRNFRDLHALML